MDAKVLRAKGEDCLKRLQLKEALACFNQAIELDGNDSLAYASRAGTLNCLQRFEESLLDAEKSIQLNGAFSKAHVQQGYAFQHLGLYKEALGAYKRALQLESGSLQIEDLIRKTEEKIREQERVEKEEHE